MAKLGANERANLPDRAFAYVDSRGRRRLPIHDASHVKNAFARFNQVAFESEAARERARKRLLRAARRFGIVPIGFITGQIEAERQQGVRPSDAEGGGAPPSASLPSGYLTLLMADIESSTELLQRLGDRYADLLNEVRGVVRDVVSNGGGLVVDFRADDFFAVFERALDAVHAGTAIQRVLIERKWPDDVEVRIRMGIHSGKPTVTDVGYIGMAVHATARVCAAAHGGQIVVSGETKSAIGDTLPPGVCFQDLGRHRLVGVPGEASLFYVEAEGLVASFPPPRTAAVRRGEP